MSVTRYLNIINILTKIYGVVETRVRVPVYITIFYIVCMKYCNVDHSRRKFRKQVIVIPSYKLYQMVIQLSNIFNIVDHDFTLAYIIIYILYMSTAQSARVLQPKVLPNRTKCSRFALLIFDCTKWTRTRYSQLDHDIMNLIS